MAKKQSRRTVSIGDPNYTRLVEYARAGNASASQVTEYALDAQFKAPIDRVAFDAWRLSRAYQAAEQGVRTAARSDGLYPHQRREQASAERAAENERARAERDAVKVARMSERAAVRERNERRAKIRAELGGGKWLCKHCDGPHASRVCPGKPYIPQITGSRGERAALACRDECLTQREAAARFGITFQAVSSAWRRLFPGVRPPRRSRDNTVHAIVVEMARIGRPIAEISEQTGYSAETIHSIARKAGVVASTRPGLSAAFDAAVAAVASGATMGEAAADHGVSVGRLYDKCMERGVKPSAKSGRRNGRAVAAANLVESDGLTFTAAARAMRCSPTAVQTVVQRRRCEVAP